jgi:hypothetical protein
MNIQREFKTQIIKTMDQWESGLLYRLNLEKDIGTSLFSVPAFNKCRTYAFETLFSISVDFFCIVYSILTNIRYAAPDYRHSNA